MSRIQAHCDHIDNEIDLLIEHGHWTEANEWNAIQNLRFALIDTEKAFKQTKPEEFDKE